MVATVERPLDIRKTSAAKFTGTPKVTKTNKAVKKSFSINTASDVEGAVLNAKGRVIRHLAAGLLGKNAPVPFKKNSLAQELSWDMKNDAGKQLPAGPSRFGCEPGPRPAWRNTWAATTSNWSGPAQPIALRPMASSTSPTASTTG